MRRPLVTVVIIGWLAVLPGAGPYRGVLAVGPQQQAASAPSSVPRTVLDRYCVTCHNQRLKTGGLALDVVDVSDPSANAETWEKVVQKMRGRLMPPASMPRPDEQTYDRLVSWLETELDRSAAARPNPGRAPIRRLNRAEYINAIRDLLALEIDEQSLLFPVDDADEQGFETNAGVLSVSPALLDRYLSAANRISHLAVGDRTVGPGFATATYSTPKMLYQDERMSEALPFGTRGGIVFRQNFPVDGEYVIKIRLRRQVYDYIIGMADPQELDLRIDGQLVKRFAVGDAESKGYPSAYTFFGTIRGDPEWEEFVSSGGDAGLEIRVPVKAGTRTVGVAFVKAHVQPTGIRERRLSGFGLTAADFYHGNAAVERVTVDGPYNAAGPGDSPSRRRIFECRPKSAGDEERCARQILSSLARRAYRRPVTDDDVRVLLDFYRAGQREDGFEVGIQKALERLLIAPEFLFRIAREPAGVAAGTSYRISDLELASRLSFFLWSSIPDDELLTVAASGRLHDPAVLERQVQRMLADSRSAALVDNFASQWLQLNRTRGMTRDPDVFFEFDDNLRTAMEQETKLFVHSQLREDRSAVELLTGNYTFLNESLARHYGVPGVYGERFRRVTFAADDDRGGLLGHASLLAVTSYPTRTSPVLRGKWILDNILGVTVPPPPPDVPDLEENRAGQKVLSMRERMEEHRANAACATCHRVMDPLGFSLEKYDALGRSRVLTEAGKPIDSSGTLVDGTAVHGPASLRRSLGRRPEQFVSTFTQKLLTYSLGRSLEYYDQPAIRRITRDAASDNYRWSSIILGIVKSVPFQMRRSES